MKNTVLQLNNITKKYGAQTVLNNTSMNISKGDIYGLIGRNGAGKTTIMKIITDLVQESNGEVILLGNRKGFGYSKGLQRIGAVIEAPAAYSNLSAYANMKAACIQKGVHDYSSINELLELVNLSDTGKKTFKKFSLGMKQKLGIAMALINNPDFLILDEPINGLDPIAIVEFRDILERINKERNTTIMISSHILSELYQTATRFGFIHNGEIIEEISKSDFDNKCGQSIQIEVNDIHSAIICLQETYNISVNVVNDNIIQINEEIDTSALNKTLVINDIDVIKITKNDTSLEDYYTNLIKNMEGK